MEQTKGHTQKRRKVSVAREELHEDSDVILRGLTLEDSQPRTNATIKRRSSLTAAGSPAKRRSSGQNQPLAHCTDFGNRVSTVRQFRRVSDNSPGIAPIASLGGSNENHPPKADFVNKEALLGRRAYLKAIDQALRETYAQLGSQSKREAISRVALAWDILDKEDPVGEYHLLKLIIDKVRE